MRPSRLKWLLIPPPSCSVPRVLCGVREAYRTGAGMLPSYSTTLIREVLALHLAESDLRWPFRYLVGHLFSSTLRASFYRGAISVPC
jgi:hypothetical protein